MLIVFFLPTKVSKSFSFKIDLCLYYLWIVAGILCTEARWGNKSMLSDEDSEGVPYQS